MEGGGAKCGSLHAAEGTLPTASRRRPRARIRDPLERSHYGADMKNVSLTRGEASLFLVTLIVPLVTEAVLAVTVFPELRWLLPTSILFPAGLLGGIAMRSHTGSPAHASDGQGSVSTVSSAS